MNYIFNQFRGLGDILFIMRIAQDCVEQGDRVIIPVEPHYVNIAKHFPGVEIVNKDKFNIPYNEASIIPYVHEKEPFYIIPFRFANDILQVPYTDCMRAKYWYWDLLLAEESMGVKIHLGNNFGENKSWQRWKDYKIERDLPSETQLFNKLNPHNEPYIFVNRHFRTNFSGRATIQKPKGVKIIEMSEIRGYTLIDWSTILERATAIHTVGTSINYLIEKLNITAPIHLYKRLSEEQDFKNYDYILDTENKKYIFH